MEYFYGHLKYYYSKHCILCLMEELLLKYLLDDNECSKRKQLPIPVFLLLVRYVANLNVEEKASSRSWSAITLLQHHHFTYWLLCIFFKQVKQLKVGQVKFLQGCTLTNRRTGLEPSQYWSSTIGGLIQGKYPGHLPPACCLKWFLIFSKHSKYVHTLKMCPSELMLGVSSCFLFLLLCSLSREDTRTFRAKRHGKPHQTPQSLAPWLWTLQTSQWWEANARSL